MKTLWIRFLLLVLLALFGIPYLIILMIAMPLGRDQDYAGLWLCPMDWWLDHWRDDSDTGLLKEWVRLKSNVSEDTYTDWVAKTQMTKIENKLKDRGLRIVEHVHGFCLER